MQTKVKRLLSLILCALLIFGSAFIPGVDMCSGFGISASAANGNFYMINGKPLAVDSVNDPGTGKNDDYIKALYKYIWGIEYTDDFSSSDNILKNMLYETRELTPDNLKTFVGRCEPGTVLKVETIKETETDSENGYSVLIVSMDSNGFSVYERTDERHETYYTWEYFCEKYAYSTIRFLKWPNSYYSSGDSISETDYNKPSRVIYYDASDPLSGDDVKWIQQMLTNVGYEIQPDGYYGKTAEKLIKEFQKEFSLNVTGIVDAQTADMLENPVKSPDKISIRLVNKSDSHMSRGDILSVEWDKVEYADSYHIMLYSNRGNLVDELENIAGNEASFVIENAGTYIVKGCAENDKYTGEISTMEQKVKVHNTFTVQFVDEDGAVLNKQSIAYGMDASTPASPKKTGYSFVGWDKEYTNVTSNIVAKAKYVKKTYTVTFVDDNGEMIGAPQKVLYGDAATAPNISAIKGFVGWNKDFSYVDKSITVRAVVFDSVSVLPTSIMDAQAERAAESSGYTVSFSVVNNTEKRVVGRAVVALKTTTGKFLTLTESSAFVLNSSVNGVNGEKNLSVFVPYSKAATIAEIYIVENYNDLVPISAVKTITEIKTDNNYSDWLPDEEAPSVYFSATDYRTEYRCKKKERTSSTASSKAGWTFERSAITSYIYSGWSDYSYSPITATADREVRTENESRPTGYNIYECNTQGYYSPYYRHYWSDYHSPERSSYGEFHRWNWVSISEWNYYASIIPGARSSGTYNGYNTSGATGRADSSGMIWFYKSTTTTTVTKYRYQDRYPVYTYYYYRWNEWSDWSTTPIESSADVEVETRQTRQYEVNDPTVSNTGKTRTVTGVVDSSLAGKEATLFIYKIGDASDYTNEFVGQTKINQNGSYYFSFKLREEPSVETGDFYVTLGIEGTNTVFELDLIKAPSKEYTVNICDFDGTVLSSQTVKRGDSAILPKDNPIRLGYTFAGWNYSNASIYEDTNITALYVQNEYTVVFIDWTNETFKMVTGFHYGDLLTVPSLNLEDKYSETDNGLTESIGRWKDVTSGMTVTENMVITAEYDEKVFNVNFYDYDNKLISTQEIKYGESAESPELESDDEHMFISWDNYDYDFVTKDITIKPVFCYAKTTEMPTANISKGVYSQSQLLSLNCTTENAVIYYSINGGAEKVYTSPITVDSTAEITYYAAAFGYNNSEKTTSYYIINKADDNANWKYPVNIYNGDSIVYTEIVDAGTTIGDIESLNNVNGYIIDGLYTESTFENKWNETSDSVVGELNLYAKYAPKEYTVTFAYEPNDESTGDIISTVKAKYMESVNPPEISPADNKAFVGWSSDGYDCVTDDIVIYAIVRDESETVNISLNKTELTMISGMSFNLVPIVTPDKYLENTIVWKSSNPSVVTVNDKGVVTAVAPGNATITSTISGDTVVTASCSVTVYANKSEDLCMNKDADIVLVDGNILGIVPDNNSVEYILGQIDSDELKAYSVEGKELDLSDKMETGSTICLVDNSGKVLDMATVIISGDINADGSVNNKDAAMLMRYMVNKEQLTDVAILASDVNADGHVSLQDVAVLQQYIIGMQTALSK